jgi:carbon-monoxide dehydrogenase large subunit
MSNFPKPSEFPYQTACGLHYDSGDYEAAMKKAKKLVGWNDLLRERDKARRAGRLFGVGVSTYVEICAIGPSQAVTAGGWEWGCVRIEFSGKVTVITGATPHGQGQETSFAQLVAERLGVPMDDVVVLRGDTNIAHYGRDTYGSRTTVLGGTAIMLCVDKILAKATILAAHLLETDVKKVSFADGRFSAGGKSVGWGDVASQAYVARNIPADFEPGLEASTFFEPKNFTFPFGAHIVAVDIDQETGHVKIVKYVAVDDCGPQINPLLVEGQVQGGIAHSIGQVLFEQTIYDESGQLLTGEFMDYPMPRAEDVPEYILGNTVTPSPSNPLGIKGVGEAGTIGATPAIANAIMDALQPLGIRHLDLPMTPEKIWRAIAHGTQPKSAPPPDVPVPTYARYTSDEVGEGALEVGNV